MAPDLSQEAMKSWGDKEKVEFIEFCQKSLQSFQGKDISTGLSQSDITHVLIEFCWNALHGSLSVDSVISTLAEIINLHCDLPSLVADILVILDAYTGESHNFRDKFNAFLKSCNTKIVPEYTMKERMEFETLNEAGVIKVLRSIQTKFIKTKTRLFYKQQKYNLFREETEGFAKLITELNPSSTSKSDVHYALEVMRSLIGCFNLDPNRVLDIILESFEYTPELADFFIPLLHLFSSTSETISQVIGFKFSFYQNGNSEPTPSSLYRVTALLLKSNVMCLGQLYGMLSPSDGKIIEDHKQAIADAQSYVKQINSLASASDAKESAKELNKTEEDNQKLGLCEALVDVGDWERAHQLMMCFPDYYATSHVSIGRKLCSLIHARIYDFYKKKSTYPELTQGKRWVLESGYDVKPIEDFSELFQQIFPMVLVLGPHLHIDPILMAKIIRLSRCWMNYKPNVTEAGVKAISEIVEESLLPSLSLMECNCCMAEDLWNLLKLFPYQVRYNFYCRWKTSTSVSHPLLIKAKANTLKRLKYIMKRLSRENVKPSGRQIGKLSHSNPGYIFDYILSQIQKWDNLIVPVIDSLKYLSSLSYDVMAYCIIEALGNLEKDRMKHDGTSISEWLQSLANFGGAIFKKYPIDISGLLQYVANQLKAEKSVDLLVLNEVVQKMAGIEAVEEMTSDQLEAMTGGELLRSEGGYFNQLRNVKKSSQRLKEALLEHGLAIPLCLLMAQQRQCILFHEQENSHIKLIGKLYDQCNDTLVQYGSFLANCLNMEDYANRLPSVSILLNEYFVPADVSFFLSRPVLNHTIISKFEELKKQDKSFKNINNTQGLKKYLEIVDSVMAPIISSIKLNQTPRKNWEDLSPQFYVTFWSLSMYDLMVPSESYDREVNKLKVILQNEDNKDASKKKKEKERCEALINKLLEEEKMQQEHCFRVTTRLKAEKDDWFQSKAAKNETITQFLQLCLFPRCVFTSVDAIYCAKFVHLIHCLKTPNFSTLLCYDRVFCDITYTVAACTENEANRYGLFLCSMLETVMRWHRDKAVFDKECANFPGFMTKFKVASQTGDSPSDHVDYENYRHVCHKWHFKLTKALLKCLESEDYVQIRNSLIVLSKIAPFFPVVTNLSQALERRIEKIRLDEKDKRHDISTLATAYSGVLKSKKGSLLQESEFHVKSATRAIKQEPKLEKKESENATEVKEKPVKVEAKSSSSTKPTSNDKQVSQSSSQPSAKKARIEAEHNGIDNNKSKIIKLKEEKLSSESTSPLRRDDTSKGENEKSIVKEEKRERREDRHEKSQSSNSKESSASPRDSHSHRRPLDLSESDREHKRRRADIMTRSPRDISDREARSAEKLKDDDRNGSREKNSSDTKSYKESSDSASDKSKNKDKKTRKRDYPEDASDTRRRRVKAEDDDVGKRSTENERDVKSRRDEKSPVFPSNSDRRNERDDKKHHRSSSISSIKKRT